MTPEQVLEDLGPALSRNFPALGLSLYAVADSFAIRQEAPYFHFALSAFVRRTWPLADCRPLWDGTEIDGYVVRLHKSVDGKPDGRYPPCLGKTETEAWAVAAIVVDRIGTGERLPDWITGLDEQSVPVKRTGTFDEPIARWREGADITRQVVDEATVRSAVATLVFFGDGPLKMCPTLTSVLVGCSDEYRDANEATRAAIDAAMLEQGWRVEYSPNHVSPLGSSVPMVTLYRNGSGPLAGAVDRWLNGRSEAPGGE